VQPVKQQVHYCSALSDSDQVAKQGADQSAHVSADGRNARPDCYANEIPDN
jgi:hypothetical protein